MARAKSIGIRHTLTSLLPRAELDRLALDSGMVQRRRKVDPMAMLWTLVLGFGTGHAHELEPGGSEAAPGDERERKGDGAKELKSNYRLDELPTCKAPIVEALILASVLTLLVSRQLLDAVRRQLPRQPVRVPEERWASLLAAVAIMILDIVLLPPRIAEALARRLEPMLLHEARDPNVSRLLLLERVDQGVAWVH